MLYIYMNIAKFISFYPLQLNQIKYLCAYINFMGSGGGDVVYIYGVRRVLRKHHKTSKLLKLLCVCIFLGGN